MALKAISGAAYQEAAKTIQKPKVDTVQPSQSAHSNVAETPSLGSVNNQLQKSQQENGKQENAPTDQQLKNAIDRANNKLKAHRTKCEFAYHEETNRVSIKIMDKETEEVIKEIPPEETLEMIEKMWELAGLLIDEKR